jgi:GT2 family glycosyltransferase/glycosyltransferase involved in cell wall biosynthesis
MPARPFAAAPSANDEPAMRKAPLRICIYALDESSATQLDALRVRLPANARLALLGAGATGATWPDAERVTDASDAQDLFAMLAAAAARFPGEDLVLVRADLDLPAFACERLLRALDAPDVLAALPLDGDRHPPIPPDLATDLAAGTLDALCYAYSDHALCDDAGAHTDAPPGLSAWHGARLARLGTDGLRERLSRRDILDAGGLRVVVLDHLYVGRAIRTPLAPERDPRDPSPPSPLAPLQQRIAAALGSVAKLSCPGLDAKPVILHVLHGWGGGAERWVRDFAAADSAAHHLVLIARGSFTRRCHGEWLELHDGSLSGPPLRRWPLPRAIADTALADSTCRELLADVLRTYCVDAVIVSSLIGHSLDALRTGLPTTCVVHDHYPLWPTLHRDFGDAALRFDDALRAADLAAQGDDREFANVDPAHWRRLRDGFVAAALEARATLIAPSRSALANQRRLAPELAALPSHVIAHGLAAWPDGTVRAGEPPARERLRLVMIGRVRKGKGAALLAAALPALREHAELFLLGAGSDAHALFGEAGVHVLLDYRRDELPALLARLQPDAALLLPTVAETFSYTLSELRSLGVPVIATRIGALAERIDDGNDGFLVEASADALVTRVAALAADRALLARVRAAADDSATTATMAAAYHDVLRLPLRPSLRYPLAGVDAASLEAATAADALRRSHAQAAVLSAQLAAAMKENERRGDWGHALDRELGQLRREFDERTQWALALNEELQDVKPRYEQVLASSSWRITAPLRSANARLRRVRASLAFRSARLRNAIGRTRGSLAQRGLAGTLARIAQEFGGRGAAKARAVHAEPKDDATPFTLPTSATPRVSIVIPVYNKVAYTLACLRSLAERAGDVPFEVIVVDDGSSDATPQRLAGIGGIRALRNAENLGFIGSCNAGAAVAQGEYVLFLNNDTVVTAGWLEALLRCIEQAPQAGLVGAKLVYPDGRLQESGGIVFDDASGWNYGRFDEPDDPRYSFRREVDYCSGAAILLRRDLFARLGRFDTRYAPAYYEDTDLAFAVRAAGFKVYVEPASVVVHFEGITSGTDTASGIKRYQVVNREKFQHKWKDALARQPKPGTPINLAATHRATKRVLIVDATTPMPDHDSGSLRMVNLMRVLADLGCQVSFMPENRLYVERYTDALQELGVEALYAPYAQDPVKFLRERGREFDLVILSRHYVAASLVGLVRLYAPQARLAFDTVDLHYLREQRAAELSGDATLARHAAATRAQELKLIRESDVTLVVSPVEKELLTQDAPGARVEVLSNVHEVYGCRKPFGARRDLVFVGGFQHPPNADAVEWFVGEVFARVRAELPDVRLHVIGSRVPPSIRALADAAVIVHGFVEDILPYMDDCRGSVAPLRYGAGVKGKVNMAMSCGLPVVATAAAVEGMHVVAGNDVLVADDATAFAAEVVRLYRDEALWNRLSANGLANVERHFSFAAARAAAARLL